MLATSREVAGKIESLLAWAQERLSSVADYPAAWEALRAAAAFLSLHRPPEYANYDPGRALEARRRDLESSQIPLSIEALPECVGDAEQVVTYIATLARAVVLDTESLLRIEAFEEEKVPRVSLLLDGPGRFPNPLPFHEGLEMAIEAFEARWTAATRGGRVDRLPNGLVLRLSGVRAVPDSFQGLDPLLTLVQEAERRARLAVAGEQSTEQAHAAAQGVAAALASLDAEAGPRAPTDFGAVLTQAIEAMQQALDARSIAVELLSMPAMPPLAMVRQSMANGLASLLRHGIAIMARGGAVSFLGEYSRQARACTLLASLTGTQCVQRATPFFAALRRAVIALHEGAIDVASGPNTVEITLTLPDPVGRALDAWIPGCEAFTERSRQVLRLLKSGGQTPPEDLLLDGVLESEMEAWLFPALSEAPAMNLAHELAVECSTLEGASAERLAKALGQVQRGKSRKEIARPPYAAELLWAFRQDERHRAALGAHRLSQEDVEILCRALLQRSIPHVACLRIVARALAST